MTKRLRLSAVALSVALILVLPAFGQSSLVTMQNAATSTGNGTPLAIRATGNPNGAVVQLNGPFSATIAWEATLDNVNWYSVKGYNLSTQTSAPTASVTGIYTFFVPNAEFLRARISAYAAGSVTALGRPANVSNH